MKTKHTSGPWEHSLNTLRRDQFGNPQYVVGYVEMGFFNSLATVHNRDSDFDNYTANALLIAAAPGLLAACELVMHPMADPEEVRAAMIAAIAKAKGE